MYEIYDAIGSGYRIRLKNKSRFVYTEATIFEVMRLSALAPFALPRLTTKDTVLDGYDIDKGTVALYNLHSVLFDKGYWGDPQNILPERLIDNNSELDWAKCNYILSFGLGRRRCVGDLFCKDGTISSLLQCYKTVLVFKAKTTNQTPYPGLVLFVHPNRFVLWSKESNRGLLSFFESSHMVSELNRYCCVNNVHVVYI